MPNHTAVLTSLNVHVREGAQMSHRLYVDENRLTITIEGNGNDLTLFLDAPELAQLDRVVSEARDALVTARRENTEAQ